MSYTVILRLCQFGMFLINWPFLWLCWSHISRVYITWYLSRGWAAPISSKCVKSYTYYEWLSCSWLCRHVTITASGIVLRVAVISFRPPWQLVIFIIKKIFLASKYSKTFHTILKTEALVTAQRLAWTWNCLGRPEKDLFPFSKNSFPFSWIKVSNNMLHFILKTEALVTVVPVLWVTVSEWATRHPKPVPYNAISGDMELHKQEIQPLAPVPMPR